MVVVGEGVTQLVVQYCKHCRIYFTAGSTNLVRIFGGVVSRSCQETTLREKTRLVQARRVKSPIQTSTPATKEQLRKLNYTPHHDHNNAFLEYLLRLLFGRTIEADLEERIPGPVCLSLARNRPS